MEDGMILIIMTGSIVILTVLAMFASKMQAIANKKGATERVWAWCFWLPLLGALMVIALPDERVVEALNQKNETPVTKNKKDDDNDNKNNDNDDIVTTLSQLQ